MAKLSPTLGVSLCAAAPLALGCGRTELPVEHQPLLGADITVEQASQPKIDQIDVLLVLDNSISMADKQQILAVAVPDLVARLVDPVCVDTVAHAELPAAGGVCPAGSGRAFEAVDDIHVGIISSSLGSFGAAPFWGTGDGAASALQDEEATDDGHLLGTRPRAADLAGAPTMTADGFLAWTATTSPDSFRNTFETLVARVGEHGAGLEASQEAWFHFLVDPEPWVTIAAGPCPGSPATLCATKQGQDDVLLSQRRAFLRPGSLLAIILLSDENDCSIRPEQYYFWPARIASSPGVPAVAMPRASVECTNPNDPCCRSCVERTPDGCQPDPTCAASPFYTLGSAEDQSNLRCFDQKRRFGMDSLYPIERYVHALREPELCLDPDHPDLGTEGCSRLAPNPLYVLGPDGEDRTPDQVFFAGIVGVPWQDLQATTAADGTPVPSGTLRYASYEELERDRRWALILGDPKGSPPQAPTDPFMQESPTPRSGTNPVTGMSIAPPSAAYLASPINGHEWANTAGNDLQYACIVPLHTPRECDTPELRNPPPGVLTPGCDCAPLQGGAPGEANPLCQQPDGTYTTTQGFAKAYPGMRHLEVLKGYGSNGIVASICARNTTDPSRPDFGYRPVVNAIGERIEPSLRRKCMPHPFGPSGNDGTCTIIEATPAAGSQACTAPGHAPVPAGSATEAAVRRALQARHRCGASGLCEEYRLCELRPADALEACLSEEDYQGSPGWCYLERGAPGVNDALLVECPASQAQRFRFVGGAETDMGTFLVACSLKDAAAP